MTRKKITKYAQIKKHLKKYPLACHGADGVRAVAKKFKCSTSYVYDVHDKLFGPKRGAKVEIPVAENLMEVTDCSPWPPTTTTRGDILDIAKQYITKDRAEEHGDLASNFSTIAAYWSTHLNTPVSVTDVAVMMNLVKVARIQSNSDNLDNWIDGCGYLACGGELVGGD